jgi:hypothetical protein
MLQITRKLNDPISYDKVFSSKNTVIDSNRNVIEFTGMWVPIQRKFHKKPLQKP